MTKAKRIIVTVLAFATVRSLGAHVAEADARIDFCQLTARAALLSCMAGARDDDFLASGKCFNVRDAAARDACNQQASADAQDARQTCKDQHGVRRAVCRRFGAAPYAPVVDPANFVATIDNPLFPLVPGTTFVYEGQTADGLEHDEFAVTHTTKVILGVTCVEVHDTLKVDGVLHEDTRDWFAQDLAGNVWYFGENTAVVDGGLPVDLAGSWMAGVDGAEPGIIMKASPAVGDFYRQEFLLGDAEDLAEVKSLTDAVTVPYGSFTQCLRTEESSSLEPGVLENKFYAAGVGNLLTVDLTTGERSELVQITTE